MSDPLGEQFADPLRAAGPYVRADLRATRYGRLFWAEELAGFREALDDALNDPAVAGPDPRDEPDHGDPVDPSSEADLALDLVAAYGRLRRTRPGLLTEADRAGLAAAERRLTVDRLRQAVAAIDLSGWRDRLSELDERSPEADDPGALALDVSGLVDALDEARLVAGLLGLDCPRDLQDELARSDRAVDEHADVFYAAAVTIQSLAALIRPDLETFDPRLAGSGRGFQRWLDGLRDVQADLYQEGLPTLAALLERPSPTPIVAIPGEPGRPARRRLVELPSMSLAARAESPPAATIDWSWTSPDGRWAARVRELPRTSGGRLHLYLVPLGGDAGEPADPWRDVDVRLFGVVGSFNAGGVAGFPYHDVQVASVTMPDDGPSLVIGGVSWSES